ncbi:MAG TPA: thioredoxin [Burkholderiales bacterium]|nr:thioredoxin [Burkholderiales bacterium]
MSAHAIDVSEANFEQEVLEASKTLPVVVDFWAPWCGPCKVLKPILEKLAAEYGGRFKLAKVNSDESQGLAAAFGIRSIPDVMAFRDGKPVSHFLGAMPESQVRAFIEGILPKPSETEQVRAAALRAAGDRDGAVDALRSALTLDTANDPARLDLAELLVELGRTDEAETLLGEVRPNIDWDARVEALQAAVSFARMRASGTSEATLRDALARNPDDHATRFALAELLAGARRYREALDELIEIVRRGKDWNDGAARKQVLNIFNLAEKDVALVAEYRRKLASALY